MKFLEEARTVELTARNIDALTRKLDDPASMRTLISGCHRIAVFAREDEYDTEGRPASPIDIVTVTRSQLDTLAGGDRVETGGFTLVPVPDSAHYSDRAAGEVYMPSSGEYL
ncbi:hypothetical protein ACT17_28300 [Mycolicibacterium conceptionense]|uniref:Uncharacterized protein n=2 Tax=Mycolicibacterium conceptionense TaxID=451644 RepID=A0A0J8TZK5_9MYCO|nr:hypothetical protein ACT17_28300 [Mycolicibacterium conceptionense]